MRRIQLLSWRMSRFGAVPGFLLPKPRNPNHQGLPEIRIGSPCCGSGKRMPVSSKVVDVHSMALVHGILTLGPTKQHTHTINLNFQITTHPSARSPHLDAHESSQEKAVGKKKSYPAPITWHLTATKQMNRHLARNTHNHVTLIANLCAQSKTTHIFL